MRLLVDWSGVGAIVPEGLKFEFPLNLCIHTIVTLVYKIFNSNQITKKYKVNNWSHKIGLQLL